MTNIRTKKVDMLVEAKMIFVNNLGWCIYIISTNIDWTEWWNGHSIHKQVEPLPLVRNKRSTLMKGGIKPW